MTTLNSPGSRVLRHWLRSCAASVAMIVAVGLCESTAVSAQTTAAHPDSASSARPASHRAHAAAKRSSSKAAKAVPEPAPPPAPPAPKWPINDQPTPASVTWDSHGLKIDATNSSLSQILAEVSRDTGAKVEGLGQDQRVFGSYGPGQARDVISELLQGSGYNFLMMGEQGSGTPLEIMLSTRSSSGPATARPAAAGDSDDDSTEGVIDDRLQPPPPAPNVQQGSFGPGGPARTPQQIMDEMQRRQQQLQQMPAEINNQENPPNQ